MALNSRNRSTAWQICHFLIRFLGMNGLVAIAVGAALWQVFGLGRAGQIVMAAGAAAVIIALLVEIRGLAEAVASHRGAAGINVLVQIALATALVVGVNWFSFDFYKRFDWTWDQAFTLDPAVREKLTQLRGDTDIIVYLPHVSFGQRVDLRQDEYDQSAEKIIIKKVEDLADQFKEFGSHFRVHVLDTQTKTSKAREEEIKAIFGATKDTADPKKDEKNRYADEMLATIKNAPENSIFFYSRDPKQMQRLSFNDIYQLDKKASKEANEERGNLVLNYQGVNNFADKVFKIEEKEPRVGFAVIHGVLGQDGTEEIGMRGLKTALATRGFKGRDIVLKKWPERTAAALEHEENRYEIFEAQKNHFERVIKELDDDVERIEKARKFWETTKIDDIDKELVLVRTNRGMQPIARKQLEAIQKSQGKVFATAAITDAFRQEVVSDYTESIDELKSDLASAQKKLSKAIEEQGKLRVDNLAEQRRITDVRAKFNRLLADVDLLVVPRATMFNVVRGDRIPSGVYTLEEAQIEAIKDFMKAGKPVLFLLGPMNEPRDDADAETKDSLEKLLASFDIQLPNQAILYNTEGDSLAESDDGDQLPGGGNVEIPAAQFDWKTPAGRSRASTEPKTPQPIRTSMKLTAHGLGDKMSGDLRIRSPRPVYVVRTWSPEAVAGAVGAMSLSWPAGPSQALATVFAKSNPKVDEGAVFLMTDPESWNESKPFRADKWVPHFERPKADDPNKGTVQEKRRGPFPIGVALEANVPAEWYGNDAPKKPVKVRLAVIGQGGLFIGEKLPPMREKLFLDVSNWLLGRDNLLARDSATWEYPRVEMSSPEKLLWICGAFALPVVFLYLGMIVWLIRRMR